MTIGESITLEELEPDPYPSMRGCATRSRSLGAGGGALAGDPVRGRPDVDLTPEVFTAETDPSTLNRTMGKNMLGSEGPDQQRIRRVIEAPFRPRDVEARTRA